jgi:hypothetical protein
MPSSNSYASVAQIETHIGDLVLSRTFSSTTVPTSTSVEAMIDFIAADMNRALGAAGYTAPISSGTNSIEKSWAEFINAMGTSALIIRTVPSMAIALDVEDAADNRAQSYQRLYDRGIKQIEENKIAAARSRGRMTRVFAGSQEDSAGERKKPVFTRGMTDYPGRSNLTE